MDLILPTLLVQQVSPVIARRLHNNNATNGLSLLIGLVNKQIGKGPQKTAGAELKNSFWQRHD